MGKWHTVPLDVSGLVAQEAAHVVQSEVGSVALGNNCPVVVHTIQFSLLKVTLLP